MTAAGQPATRMRSENSERHDTASEMGDYQTVKLNIFFLKQIFT